MPIRTGADTKRVCVADPHVNAPVEPKDVDKNSSTHETNPDLVKPSGSSVVLPFRASGGAS
jgi:hypothetical protein